MGSTRSREKNMFVMKSGLVCLIVLAAGIAQAQTPSIEIKDDGLKNETELTLVDAKGNSVSTAFGAKQQDAFMWEGNVVKGQARYFNSSSNGTESARNWDLALRYERELSGLWSIYAGQGVESDVFAGVDRRYNTDIGGRYSIVKNPVATWAAEAGYRYTDQTAVSGIKSNSQYGRLYSEAVYTMTETSSAKLWVEYLPNFSHNNSDLLNGEVSISAALNAMLSLKVAYLVKYNAAPPPPATQYLDRLLTTSLVAKF